MIGYFLMIFIRNIAEVLKIKQVLKSPHLHVFPLYNKVSEG